MFRTFCTLYNFYVDEDDWIFDKNTQITVSLSL